MAALLLRRLIIGSFDEFYPTLAPEIQAGMKEQLLLAVHEEQNDVVRKKVCDVVAELARSFIDEEGVNHWPESLKFLFDLVSSPNAALREAALLILSVTPGIFANQQQHYMDVIRQMLLQCLGDTENPQVRLAAVKATTAFLLAHDKEPGVQRHFVDCLPGLLSGVAVDLRETGEVSGGA
ncbi:PREDICTED: importin-5-like [Priapulus caudatus]|uniref:Importin-5-like n=1 Tax=Priapulus caudatus TaxID=37621 RepID=A0ABM1DVH2_PRICU|nr:PREDICTED: importin-5-like [Priapulus caudatus]